jgi:uncharacterized protein (TIGR03435 family)
MRRDKQDLDELLDRNLGLFKASSRKQPDASREVILQKLQSQPVIVTEEASRKSTGSRWRYLLAAATLAIIFAAVWLNRPAAATFEAGGKIQFGQAVHASGANGTVIVLRDGSGVEMRANSQLVLESAQDGMRIQLKKGAVIVNAAKQLSGHLYVQTKDVTVSVVGTVFLVNAEATGSRVAVIEGEVRVQQGTTEKKLLPGQQLASNPALKSISLKEEIAWSRNAEKHLALLEVQTEPPVSEQKTSAGVQTTIPPVAEHPTSASVQTAKPPTIPHQTSGRVEDAAPAKRMEFEVVSIKPIAPNNPVMVDIEVYPGGRVQFLGQTVQSLIAIAYGLSYWQVSGGEPWMEKDAFNVEAKPTAEPGVIFNLKHTIFGIDDERLREMLKAVLIDRFQLKFHRETRSGNVYLLERGERPLLLQPFEPPAVVSDAAAIRNSFGSIGYVGGQWGIFKTTMPELAKFAADFYLHAPVLDRTQLGGLFDYRQSQPDLDPNYTDNADSFLRMIQAIGLKLERSKGPVETFVIDSAAKPTPN